MNQDCEHRNNGGQWRASILKQIKQGHVLSPSWLQFGVLLLIGVSLWGISAIFPLSSEEVSIHHSAPHRVVTRPVPLYPEQLAALVEGGPCTLAVADLNADGHLDLITANAASDDVAVFLGTGLGTFQTPQHLPVGVAPVALVVADLNADDHLDLITANAASRSITVFLGTGMGTFQAPRHFPAGLTPATMNVVDLDANGHRDVLITNIASPDVTVLLGTGTGTFESPQRFAASRCTIDLEHASVDAQSSAMRATTAELHEDSIALASSDDDLLQGPRCIAPSRPTTALVADFNADGHQDLVAIRPAAGDIMLLLSTADGSYQPPRHSFTSEQGPATVALADLNADGRPDVGSILDSGLALPTFSKLLFQNSALEP